MSFGIHVDKGDFSSDDFYKILKMNGFWAIQIFSDNKILDTSARYKMRNSDLALYIHSSYYINLCASDDNYGMKLLREDMILCSDIGGRGVVVHPGSRNRKSTVMSKETAMGNLVGNIKRTLAATKKSSLIIETPAGSGYTFGTSIEELAEVYHSLTKKEQERVKFCIDTCHVYSLGYNMKSTLGVELFFHSFDEHIGIEKICLIHLNDSDTGIFSFVDRHKVLGTGSIYTEPNDSLGALKDFCEFYGIDVILETGDSFPYDTFLKEKRLYESKPSNRTRVLRFLEARLREKLREINSALLLMNEETFPDSYISVEPNELLNKLRSLNSFEGVIKKAKLYRSIMKLTEVRNIGPEGAKKLYHNHGIRTISQLKKMKDFPSILNRQQQLGLKYYQKLSPVPRKTIEVFSEKLKESTAINAAFVVVICGSYRRGSKTSGDIDIMLCPKGDPSTNYISQSTIKSFTSFIDTKFKLLDVESEGEKKRVAFYEIDKQIVQVDIRLIQKEQFATCLLMMTGNARFNVRMRNLALTLGYSLNEYHLMEQKTETKFQFNSEHEIFEFLGMPFIPPEKRDM